jgi:class 3 adenylate cyclase
LAPALARNGGRLVKLTGDGALADFDSAVDALRAALELLLSAKNSELTDIHRLPKRQRSSRRAGAT